MAKKSSSGGSREPQAPKKRKISIAARRASQKRHMEGQYAAKRALKQLTELGVYNPLDRKITKGRKSYIQKLIGTRDRKTGQQKEGKFGALVRAVVRGEVSFVPVKGKKTKREAVIKGAAEAGLKTTRKGVIIPSAADGMKLIKPKIVRDRKTKKYAIEGEQYDQETGEVKEGKRSVILANPDDIKKTLARKFRAERKKGKKVRFVVYGTGLSRNVYSDFDDMYDSFETHYTSFQEDPSGFMSRIELVSVNSGRDPNRNSLYNDLFRKVGGGSGIGGILIGYDHADVAPSFLNPASEKKRRRKRK